MRSEDIREYLRCAPFQPFRLTLTDGWTYEVRHPELAMLGRSSMLLGFPRADETEPIYDRFVTISLLHVMQAEPIGEQNASVQRS